MTRLRCSYSFEPILLNHSTLSRFAGILLTIASGLAWNLTIAFSQHLDNSLVKHQITNGTTYRLVWSDEFDRDGIPDPKNWNFESGFVRNQELQWYQRENATCQDGSLVIQARRERVKNPCFSESAKNWKQKRPYAEYSSACVTTRGLHCWTFGRIEARARFAACNGLWPAIWTVGKSGPWPDAGEVDIMEYYQGHLLANACWSSGKPWRPTWDSAKIPLSEFGDESWASEFHTWRMDWDEKCIKLFVDDYLLNVIDISQTTGSTNKQSSPFHQPHYLLLNLAIGGTNGGDPLETEFPATFEIDYVRVYESTIDP